MDVVGGVIEARSARQREQRESIARPARVRFFIPTEGTGQVLLTGQKSLFFGVWMLEEPTFTFGCTSETEEPLRPGEFPLATAIVTEFEVNDNGAYIGASVGLRVDSFRQDMAVKFSLCFEGYAMRSYIGKPDS